MNLFQKTSLLFRRISCICMRGVHVHPRGVILNSVDCKSPKTASEGSVICFYTYFLDDILKADLKMDNKNEDTSSKNKGISIFRKYVFFSAKKILLTSLFVLLSVACTFFAYQYFKSSSQLSNKNISEKTASDSNTNTQWNFINIPDEAFSELSEVLSGSVELEVNDEGVSEYFRSYSYSESKPETYKLEINVSKGKDDSASQKNIEEYNSYSNQGIGQYIIWDDSSDNKNYALDYSYIIKIKIFGNNKWYVRDYGGFRVYYNYQPNLDLFTKIQLNFSSTFTGGPRVAGGGSEDGIYDIYGECYKIATLSRVESGRSCVNQIFYNDEVQAVINDLETGLSTL